MPSFATAYATGATKYPWHYNFVRSNASFTLAIGPANQFPAFPSESIVINLNDLMTSESLSQKAALQRIADTIEVNLKKDISIVVIANAMMQTNRIKLLEACVTVNPHAKRILYLYSSTRQMLPTYLVDEDWDVINCNEGGYY